MLKIEKDIFFYNLKLTQKYCELQLKQSGKSFASILRSYNPDFNGQKLFEYSINPIAKKQRRYNVIAKCTTKLFEDDYANLTTLYKEQLFHKRNYLKGIEVADLGNGEILVFNIEQTLMDGAAEVASHGFFDSHNCPPIDTWLYLVKSSDGLLVLAWIPEPFVSFANDGVSVNPENCIDWFKVRFPNEHKRILEIKESKFLTMVKVLFQPFQK